MQDMRTFSSVANSVWNRDGIRDVDLTAAERAYARRAAQGRPISCIGAGRLPERENQKNR